MIRSDWRRLEDALRQGVPPEDVWGDPSFRAYRLHLPYHRGASGRRYFDDVIDSATWEAVRTWRPGGKSLRNWVFLKLDSRQIDQRRKKEPLLGFYYPLAEMDGREPRTSFEDDVLSREVTDRLLSCLTQEERTLLDLRMQAKPEGVRVLRQLYGRKADLLLKDAVRKVKENMAHEERQAALLEAKLDEAVAGPPAWRKRLPGDWQCSNPVPHVCIGRHKLRAV
jgi:hypothetical protein